MKQKLLALVFALGLVACSASDIPAAKSTLGRDPSVAEVPNRDETVRGDSDPAIVTLDLDTTLHEHRLGATDALPGNIIIPTTNLDAVPVTAALQAVLSGTDVSLSWNTGTFGSRLVTIMNVSGPLPKVVEKICSAAKVFCDYRHGSLQLSENETFVVELPPAFRGSSGGSSSSSSSSSSSASSSSSSASSSSSNASAGSSMVMAISELVKSKELNGKDVASNAVRANVQVDEQGGNIIYTTTVDGEDRVSQYLKRLRTGRPLVVLQMYLWEVTLTRENAQGINWSQLSISNALLDHGKLNLSSTSSLNSVATTAGSVSLGAVTTGVISATSIANFLATKGQVQSISNPQVTFVSGTSAQLKVGGTQRYISQVGAVTGTNVSGTNSSSNSGSGASTNTVSTDSIDTGLTIDVAGSYENGVVFANLDVTLKNLVSLNPTNSGGGTIDLPQTTDEKMSTVLRVRPGDSLVLAGLVTSNDARTSQGFPTSEDGAVPLYGDMQRNNHELVMIVKPSVVLFADKNTTDENKKKENARPLPDAVVIEGGRSRTLTMPVASSGDTSARTERVGEASAAAAVADVPPPPLPLPPSDSRAAVDKRLMQGAFSNALDQMTLPPESDLASAGGGNQ